MGKISRFFRKLLGLDQNDIIDYSGDGSYSMKGDGNTGSPKGETVDDSNKSKGIGFKVALVVVVVLGIYFLSGLRVVKPTQVAVVERFGYVVGVRSAGINYGFRFIDKFVYFDVNQQNVKDTYSTATIDMQSVDQIITTQYTVDPSAVKELYLKFLGNHRDSIIVPVLSQSIKEVASKYTIEELIAKRSELGEEMSKSAKARLAEYGIKVVSVQIVNLELPDEYKKAVEAKKVAEQNVQKANAELEQARINAEANRVTSASYDANIKYKEFLSKWDGKLPTYMGGDGLNMLLPSPGGQ